MRIESYIRIIAGSMILLSLVLTRFVSPWWWVLTAFVGVNLIQSALTGFCPAEIMLKALGVGKGGCSTGDRATK